VIVLPEHLCVAPKLVEIFGQSRTSARSRVAVGAVAAVVAAAVAAAAAAAASLNPASVFPAGIGAPPYTRGSDWLSDEPGIKRATLNKHFDTPKIWP